MSVLKRCSIVMLSTEKATKIVLCHNNYLDYDIYEGDCYVKSCISFKNLYMLSDEEIKEGDWYVNLEGTFNDSTPKIEKCESELDAKVRNTALKIFKKIIATTDKSLNETYNCIICDGIGEVTKCSYHLNSNIKCDHCDGEKQFKKHLPEPSEGFIKAYIEAYNNGNPIIEVDVEYNYKEIYKLHLVNNNLCDDSSIISQEDIVDYVNQQIDLEDIKWYGGINPKVNPKDNTITIRKIEYSKIEKFENFLKERIAMNNNIIACAAYEIVRRNFEKIFKS